MSRILREFVRMSLGTLLTEVRLAGDHTQGSPVYRAIEVNDYSDRTKGWYIKVPVGMNGEDVMDIVSADPRFRKRDEQGRLKIFSNARPEQSMVVNTEDKTIDLDIAKWSGFQSRRGPGMTTKVKKSYTIPHADVAYDSALNFQKMLKSVMRDDDRITGDYRVLGNPRYEGMTVSGVLAQQPESDIVKGGAFKPMTFYHGTSMKRYEGQIEKRGLRPGNAPFVYSNLVDNYSEHNVYLTTSVSEAENYATRAAVEDKSDAVVLKLVVRDPTKLMVNEDHAGWMKTTDPSTGEEVEIHFSKPNRWKNWPNASQIMQQFQSRMMKGLVAHGTIAYRGSIPARDIEVAMTYKPKAMKVEPSREEYWSAMEKTRASVKKPGAEPVKKPKAKRSKAVPTATSTSAARI